MPPLAWLFDYSVGTETQKVGAPFDQTPPKASMAFAWPHKDATSGPGKTSSPALLKLLRAPNRNPKCFVVECLQFAMSNNREELVLRVLNMKMSRQSSVVVTISGRGSNHAQHSMSSASWHT